MLSNPRLKKASVFTGAIVFWLIVWEIAYLIADMEFILPSPITVMGRLPSLIIEKTFIISICSSLGRVLLGFLLGALCGTLVAVLMSLSPILSALFSTLLTVIKSVPVVSFILLLWLFFDSGHLPVIVVLLVTLPIFAQNIHSGLSSVDKSLLEVCGIYKFGCFKKILYVYTPAVFNGFTSAAVLSLGMAWKSGVATEVLAYVKNSVGKEIYRAKSILNTVDVFAYTAVIVAFSLLLEVLVKFLMKKVKERVA